jgi:uroporphyrinogen-III synthase
VTVPIVAVPESRQLDLLAEMLERRGMEAVRCPLVAILDSPDAASVDAWVERLISRPPDLLILYTGEGLRRLLGFAERAGQREALIAALAETPMLTRGPKPVRALHEIGLKPAHAAQAPTTAGIIEALDTIELTGPRVAVQFYGADPNEELMAYLRDRQLQPDIVMPYVYASKSDATLVVELIDRIAQRAIDAIAFTSMAQVERLFDVAHRASRLDALRSGLGGVVVAAVGPVVAEALRERGVEVDVMPESTFFMKPLVTRLATRLEIAE